MNLAGAGTSWNATAAATTIAPVTAPATTTTASAMSTSSTTFNKGATEFVPKNKIVKTEESFPTLDAIAAAPTKAPAKKV